MNDEIQDEIEQFEVIEAPDNCLRGIRGNEHFYGGGDVLVYSAFTPNTDSDLRRGWRETSINWELDEGAIVELRSRNYDWVLRVERDELERIRERNVIRTTGEMTFDFVESPIEEDVEEGIEENIYHGDLLFSPEAKRDKPLRVQICAELAAAAEIVEGAI